MPTACPDIVMERRKAGQKHSHIYDKDSSSRHSVLAEYKSELEAESCHANHDN